MNFNSVISPVKYNYMLQEHLNEIYTLQFVKELYYKHYKREHGLVNSTHTFAANLTVRLCIYCAQYDNVLN